jgi:hypothetical protein
LNVCKSAVLVKLTDASIAFGTVNHELHRQRRGAISPLFSKQSIQQSESLITKNIRQLTAVFEKAAVSGSPLDLGTCMLAFSTDTLGHFALDSDFNLMNDTNAADNWRKTLDSVPVVTVAARQMPWLIPLALKIPRALIRPVLPDLCRLLDAQAVSSYIEACIFLIPVTNDNGWSQKITHRVNTTKTEAQENFAHSERPASIFEAIDRSAQPENEKNVQRLIQEGVTLLFAGGETIARSLSHTLFYLLETPDIYAKVKDEIDEATPEGQLIPSCQTLRSLPWLVSCFVSFKLHKPFHLILLISRKILGCFDTGKSST